MGRFHDRHHVWLRSREHGTYLQADLDDGSTLSLHSCCEAVRTAWTVHTIGRMLALHSAANGRYLAATAERFGLGGNRVILRDLDMFAAGWFPDMSASGDSIVLRHSSDQFLRAIDRGDGNGVTVEVSASRRANAHWVVEAIPSTDSIPRLPHIEVRALCPVLFLWDQLLNQKLTDCGKLSWFCTPECNSLVLMFRCFCLCC
jgi:hypothetical protein